MSKEKAFLENCQESLRTGKPLTSAIDRANLAEACSYDPKVQELCRKVLWDLDRADAYVEASKKLVLAAKRAIWLDGGEGSDTNSDELEEALIALGVKYDGMSDPRLDKEIP